MRDDNTWWQAQDEEYQQRRAEVEALYDEGKLDEKYGEWLCNHTPIGNGEMLIQAMERHILLDDFLDEEAAK